MGLNTTLLFTIVKLMIIKRNLPANIVSEIGVKNQLATHDKWRQNRGNGLYAPAA